MHQNESRGTTLFQMTSLREPGQPLAPMYNVYFLVCMCFHVFFDIWLDKGSAERGIG